MLSSIIAERTFAWVNMVLGNVKSAITGTCRVFGARRVAAYEHRFDRRADLKNMVPRLAYCALGNRPPPTVSSCQRRHPGNQGRFCSTRDQARSKPE